MSLNVYCRLSLTCILLTRFCRTCLLFRWVLLSLVAVSVVSVVLVAVSTVYFVFGCCFGDFCYPRLLFRWFLLFLVVVSVVSVFLGCCFGGFSCPWLLKFWCRFVKFCILGVNADADAERFAKEREFYLFYFSYFD